MATSEHGAMPVLIVDDEPDAIQSNEIVLRASGITNIIGCGDSRKVAGLMEQHEVGVVLLDLSMPHLSGQEVLAALRRDHPEVPVIVVTGANDVATAVECMRAGAFDYMVKPVEESRLASGLMRALDFRIVHEEYDSFRQRVFSDTLEHPEVFRRIMSRDRNMRTLFQYVETIATTNRPVLITGETGVGKELFARALHELSGRKGPFVDVSVAGLDDSVFSDTLFGHVKGAFTGADAARPGLIERASGGTLFLDEIGDLSPTSQIKLLRLLQERTYSALGSDMVKKTDARIVAATNRDLEAQRESARFRSDLFYRLNTHYIHIPPLRERLGDVPVLLDHFLETAAHALGKKKPTPPPELAALLSNYTFPGNVRELESMVFDAVSKHKTRMLSMDSFTAHVAPSRYKPGIAATPHEGPGVILPDTLPTVREITDLLISEAMKRAKGRQTIAAKILGISQPTLSRRLKHMSH